MRRIDQRLVDLDGQPAPARHGVAGIDREVEQRALQLGDVGDHDGRALGQLHRGLNRLAERPAEQGGHARHQAVDVDLGRPQHLPAREGQQARRQIGAAPGGSLGLARELALATAELRCQLLGVGQDHGQEIVEIVRDAARQVADRLHLLRLRVMSCKVPIAPIAAPA